ncbi:hypothetical protein Hanom_Chr04g00301981 [Helianthus anomalus]
MKHRSITSVYPPLNTMAPQVLFVKPLPQQSCHYQYLPQRPVVLQVAPTKEAAMVSCKPRRPVVFGY